MMNSRSRRNTDTEENSILPECANPELYVLPMSPVLLDRYLGSVILALSATDSVQRVVQGLGLVEATKKLSQSMEIGGPLVKRLANLTQYRLQGGSLGEDAFGGFNFGIYSQILGSTSDRNTFKECFGRDPDLEKMSPAAPSLWHLYDTWERSRDKVKRATPTFFLAPNNYKGRPVAVVIAGRADRPEGMELYPPEPYNFRPLNFDQIAVVRAALWALSAPASSVCVLLPPALTVGKGRRGVDITRSEGYQTYLKGVYKGLIGIIQHLLSSDATYKGIRRRIENFQSAGKELHIGSEVSDSALRFFGPFPAANAWPTVMGESVSKLMTEGFNPQEIKDVVDTSGLAAKDVAPQIAAAVGDLGVQFSVLGDAIREARKIVKPQSAEPRKIALRDINPEVLAEVSFIQKMGEPGSGLFIPTSLLIFKLNPDGETYTPTHRQEFIPVDQKASYFNLFLGGADKKIYPYVIVRAGLFNLKGAKNKAEAIDPSQAAVKFKDVEKLLEREALPVGVDPKSWYLGIINAQRVKEVDADGLPTHVSSWDFENYTIGKGSIPELLQNLLRIQVSYQNGIPQLSPIPGGEGKLWTSKSHPYFFNTIPFYDDELKQEKLVGSGDPNYAAAIKAAFRPMARSRDVKGGEMSYVEGRHVQGGTAKVGRRKISDPAAISSGYRGGAFWTLVRKALLLKSEHQKEREISDIKPSEFTPLYLFIQEKWPYILVKLNEVRVKGGVAPIDMRTPAPSEGSNIDLEKAALIVLRGLLDPNTGVDYALLLPQDLLTPRSAMAPGWEDYFPEDVQLTVRSIQNPNRGRRAPRKARKARGASRRNPIDKDDEWARLLAASKPGVEWPRGVVLEGIQPPKTSEEFVSAFGSFFPRSGPEKDLRAQQRFADLRRYDLLSRFGKAPTQPEIEESLRSWTGKEGVLEGEGDSAEELRSYVSRQAEPSAEEAKRLHEIRLSSRRERRIVTPSGALCREYRNTVRLKGYSPPPFFLQRDTSSIIVAPGEDGAPPRVMSFRNGAHVDCDMIVTPSKPLGLLIGKAIESMIFWLAEKPKRINMTRSIVLGQVGSTKFRVLWQPGSSLLPHQLLSRAYKGEPLEGPWNKESDKKNYIQSMMHPGFLKKKDDII